MKLAFISVLYRLEMGGSQQKRGFSALGAAPFIYIGVNSRSFAVNQLDWICVTVSILPNVGTLVGIARSGAVVIVLAGVGCRRCGQLPPMWTVLAG